MREGGIERKVDICTIFSMVFKLPCDFGPKKALAKDLNTLLFEARGVHLESAHS